jgi:ubiquitin C-terminal hydrolase
MEPNMKSNAKLANLGLTGLSNLGNTCFLNSAIQLLSNCHELTELIIDNKLEDDKNDDKKEIRFVKIFFKTINAMWEDNCQVTPTGIKQSLGSYYDEYKSNHQQDSSEVLQRMIDLLHEGLCYRADIKLKIPPKMQQHIQDKISSYQQAYQYFDKVYSKNYSKIIEMLYGLYYIQLRCPICNYVSESFETFNNISIPMNSTCKTLFDCLDLFTKTEVIETDNKWECSKCNRKINPEKKMHIWSLPKYLFIFIKRFDNNLNKIRGFVDFPLSNLNLKQYCEESKSQHYRYDCIGVNNHLGSFRGGHFNTCCKNPNGSWYCFDDENVEQLQHKNEIKTENVYILLYTRNIF